MGWHLGRVIRPVLGWRPPSYVGRDEVVALVSIAAGVKVMVVVVGSQVRKSWWCQEALFPPVLCHVDQPEGRSAGTVSQEGEGGVGP